MAFPYYSPVTVNSGQVPSTQTDFPILISLTDARLKTVGNGGHVQSSSGFDIRPYSDSGLTTAITGYELVFYDGANGILEMHVKRSSVSDGLITYLAYGDASITTDGSSTTTWSNSFIDVYHLKDGTTLNVASSTGAHNGTNHGATATTGQIDGGASLVSASSQYIDLGAYTSNITAVTFTCWAKATSFPNAYNTPICRNSPGAEYIALFVKSTGKLACYVKCVTDISYDGTGSNTLSSGTWYFLALTYSSSAGLVGYVNASSDKTVAANGVISSLGSDTTYVGQDPITAGRFWNGTLDEVQISNVARSANWITTEYNNQSAPGTFMTLGTEVSTQLAQSFTAALSFVGSISKKDYKNILATLSFVGSISKKGYKGISAALSFIGTPAKLLPPKIFTGTLLFTGDLFRRIGTFVYAVFTSELRFIMPDPLAATPGPLLKSIYRPIPAILSFIGSFPRILQRSLASTLSFIGTLVTSGGSLLLKSLTASLSFSGSITKSTYYYLTAILSFVGSTSYRIPKHLSATLSFSGKIIKKISQVFTAALNFAGAISTATGHFFYSSLTSTLSFIGGLNSISSAFGSLWTDIFVRVRNFLQMIVGGTTSLQRRPEVDGFNTDVSTAASELVTIGEDNIVFVKNLDLIETVEIDSANSFDQFPQRIKPQCGVYLTPELPSTIFVRSTGASSILAIVGSTSITVPTPPPGDYTWYIGFTINVHAGTDNADFIHIGDGPDNIVAVFRDTSSSHDRFFFYWQTLSNFNFSVSANGAFTLDTLFTLDIKITSISSVITVIPRVDGVELSPFDASGPGLGLIITEVLFGAIFSGGANNHNLDNLTIGTTTWGSSDLFSANFSSTIVPPFDSVTGSGISISGGTLLVINGGTDAYATKALP